MYDPDPARELRADRPLRRSARLYALQRRGAPGRAEARRPSPRLPAPEASLRRQVHACRGPLRAHLLRPLDDHGRGPLPEIQGDRRQEVLRRAERRFSRDRRARLPPRSRCAQVAAAGERSRRQPALRRGEGRRTRHPRPVGPHRVDRSEQRRERRAIRRRPRDGCRQSGVLGHGGRACQSAQGDRVRRGVRALRRPCAGAEKSGARAESRQAPARDVLGEQRGHRRLAHRRCHRQQVHRVRLRRSSGRRTAGT